MLYDLNGKATHRCARCGKTMFLIKIKGDENLTFKYSCGSCGSMMIFIVAVERRIKDASIFLEY